MSGLHLNGLELSTNSLKRMKITTKYSERSFVIPPSTNNISVIRFYIYYTPRETIARINILLILYFFLKPSSIVQRIKKKCEIR